MTDPDTPRVDRQAPLAVFAADGVSFSSSMSAFSGYAEPPDAEDGVYTAAYDRDGRRYDVVAPEGWDTREPRRFGLRRGRRPPSRYFVIVQLDESFVPDPRGVAQEIGRALERQRPGTSFAEMSLDELFDVVAPVL